MLSERASLPLRAIIAGLLALTVVLAGEAQGERGTPPCADELRPIVQEEVARLRVPGVIVLVEVPGRCQWTATFGVGSAATRSRIHPGDRVRVGSITKTFTGTIVLQLVDESRVVLDGPISQYVAGVPNGANITVRQLLNMTSGLYNYSDDPAFNRSLDADPNRVWTPAEILAIAYSHPAYFAPGTAFHYSNTNSVLLGLLAEAVTGQMLPELFKSRIFRPLGLRDTTFPTSAEIPAPRLHGHMFGTNVGTLNGGCDADTVGRRDVTTASPSWTFSAGGIISSLPDLKVWARAVATGFSLKATTQAQRLVGVPTAPNSSILYGLHVTNFNGIIGHDGALPGYQSFMGYIPGNGATLVVLANVYPDAVCGSAADTIAKAIIRALELVNP